MVKRGESMQKTEYEIPSPVNCTIALVTDQHEYDPTEVLEILREVKPDVIAVAGRIDDLLSSFGFRMVWWLS